MKDVELGEVLNVDFCNNSCVYFIDYIDQYLIRCHDNNIDIVDEIARSIEYFVKLKNEFEDGSVIKNKSHTPMTFYNHLQTIAVGIDIFSNEEYVSLSEHVKISDRKRKIKNILKN